MLMNISHARVSSKLGCDVRTTVRTILIALLLLSAVLFLSSCSNSVSSQNSGALSGNWQFSSIPLQAGFLVQNKSSVTGQLTYSIPAQSGFCSGSAGVTGTVTGQNVTLQVIAGSQTYALTATLGADGTTMSGTYTSTDGKGCGSAQSGIPWSASLVPPLAGNVTGNLHSNGLGQVTSLANQDFAVTGFLTQGPNIGATSATVTGSLNFQSYPCLTTASVNGEISGNSVVLQIIGTNGLNIGQIGAPAGLSSISPVLYQSSSAGGFILHGTSGYSINTKSCEGGNIPGDIGNICLAFGTSTACTQPISVAPSSLLFPPQLLGSPATSQTLTLTNSDPSGATLNNLQLTFQAQPASPFFPISDFNGLPNFAEQDNCSNSPGATFSLTAQQSCTITVSFSPQQSCPWIPSSASPSHCPPFLASSVPSPPALAATVTVNSSASADADKSFTVPVSGVGLSAVQPSTPEVDFGAEAIGERTSPQSLSFTNQSNSPVQILPPMSSPPCGNPNQQVPLSRPLTAGSAPGLQIVSGSINSDNLTILYTCDIDPTSKLPNFQVSSDSCSGVSLDPQQSCSLTITFAPQPDTPLTGSGSGLDYFLELNTLQCTASVTTNCEIDAGRFPVEIRANLPSPLRMTPGAGLDFGTQPRFQASTALSVTLFNDPNDPHSQTINFTGNIVKGDFAEHDNCGVSLGPGSTCTIQITFTPSTAAFENGAITITYNAGQTQTIFLRGEGQ